ncbi:MAG: lipid-A-disaccharide synthase [Candidatus Eisenbacteria bacterium]
MKILIVAGEASGDLHASRVIHALRRRRPDVEVFAVGGPRMSEAGATMVAGSEHFGVMGFTEVLFKLPRFVALMWKMKVFIERHQPQLVIAVDFPGFNLRLSRLAKGMGVPVLYYIAPQVWAWGRSRLPAMSSIVDKVAVVFPFEVELFRAHGIDVEFVGHPLLESLPMTEEKEEVRRGLGLSGSAPLLALLPGSRAQEVERLLPSMLEAARLLAGSRRVQIAVSAAETLPRTLFVEVLGRQPMPVHLVEGQGARLLYVSDAALVASGSATLEAAVLGTPLVIVYRVSPVSWFIAKRLVKLDSIGLVNIVAGKRIVSEYLQGAIDPVRISAELGELIFDSERRNRIIGELRAVAGSLGTPGASERVAASALAMLRS